VPIKAVAIKNIYLETFFVRCYNCHGLQAVGRRGQGITGFSHYENFLPGFI